MKRLNFSSVSSMLILTYSDPTPKWIPPLVKILFSLRNPSQSSLPIPFSHFNQANATTDLKWKEWMAKWIEYLKKLSLKMVYLVVAGNYGRWKNRSQKRNGGDWKVCFCQLHLSADSISSAEDYNQIQTSCSLILLNHHPPLCYPPRRVRFSQSGVGNPWTHLWCWFQWIWSSFWLFVYPLPEPNWNGVVEHY